MFAPLSNIRSKKYRLAIPCLWFIFASWGCVSITSPIKDSGTISHTMSPEVILGKMPKPDRNILKAIANIEVNQGTGRYATKVALLLKKPSSLRVEAIPIIGPVPFFLSVHEAVLKAFLPRKGLFYVGKATPENLANIANFLPTGLSVEDLLSFMLGTYPSMNGQNVFLKGVDEGQLYRIDRTIEGRKRQSIWVDLSNDRLVEVQVFNDHDRLLYAAQFEEFENIGAFNIPQKITLVSEADEHQKVIIHYSSVQPALDVETSAFDIQIPTGIEPIYLD